MHAFLVGVLLCMEVCAPGNSTIPEREKVHHERMASMALPLRMRAGCARYNMTVEAGRTYRVRMINAGSLAFLSVCFAGHNVTVVAADAYPINPLQATCVDINLGQRRASWFLVLGKAQPDASAICICKCHSALPACQPSDREKERHNSAHQVSCRKGHGAPIHQPRRLAG